jgi:hypothetical protein
MRMRRPGQALLLCITAAMLAPMGCSSDVGDGGGGGRRPITSGTAGLGGGAGGSGADDFGDNPTYVPPDPNAPVVSGGPCVNLQCRTADYCPGGVKTTVSGKVFDPAGINPLYNIAVYVPNEPLAALPAGATCDSCDSLYTGNPVAAALTDSSGSFVMDNVPDGADIPLVIQVGKWRRQFTLPSVTPCVDNPLPDGMLTLPKNRSEGDMPKIAISTGMADTLECLLRRIGVDAAEYVPGPTGDGAIHIFQGQALIDANAAAAIAALLGLPAFSVAPNTAPPAPLSSAALWNSVDSLMAYDIVLLSCEGQETLSMNQQALYDYANAGGRVFASHFHYSWFNTGPFGAENLASWMPGANDVGDVQGEIVTTLPGGQPFPKGVALTEWLGNVGALQNGLLPIAQARHNADVTPTHTPSQPWIQASGGEAAGATQYFSFNTPVDALSAPDAMFCGRVVYSDLHVGAAAGDNPINPVPTSCAPGPLTPQEAALEFMLFDLSSCLTPDDRPPEPPLVL